MVKYEDGKATQAMCKWIGNEYLVKSSSCIFVKKSPMRDFNKNRAYFFYFVTWISLSCLEILYGIHQYFDMKNLKTLGGIHVTPKSKKMRAKYLVQFLDLVSHEYHSRFSSFSCQNISEYHTKFPKK